MNRSRGPHAVALRLCWITVLLVLLADPLVPYPAFAVPHKESSGPLLGDPDTPEKPSSGTQKAARASDSSSLISPDLRAVRPLVWLRENREALWVVTLLRLRGF